MTTGSLNPVKRLLIISLSILYTFRGFRKKLAKALVAIRWKYASDPVSGSDEAQHAGVEDDLLGKGENCHA
jgi:hypothetical protein